MRKIFLLVCLSVFVLFSSNVKASPSSDEYSQMKEGMLLNENADAKEDGDASFKTIQNSNSKGFVAMDKLMAEYKQGKYIEIFDSVKTKAEEDVPEAQELVGIMYSLGQGTDKHEVEAAKWLTKAAEQEFAIAQYHLGLLLSAGVNGVDKDIVEALKWLKISSLLYKGNNIEEKNKIYEAYSAVLKSANRRQKGEAIEKIRSWLQIKNKLDLLEGSAPSSNAENLSSTPVKATEPSK